MHSSGHSHTHPHRHNHGEVVEPYAARRHPEAVVLDIGNDLGALIVHTDAGLVGVEVEISATGSDGERSHKEVLEREIEGRPAYTAVFDKVRAGSYTLWVHDIAREHGVVVIGGTVAELDWSRTSPSSRRS
jgi:ribulose-5-phosphate 4-epimerase/fuculose-1-phosphate aldolase